MKSQPLARISTTSADGQPDASPVSFEFEDGNLFVGSHFDVTKTRKFKNVFDGNTKVAFIVDDMESADPPVLRGVRIYGTAQIIEREGQFGTGVYIQIIPNTSWSWNIEKPSFIDGAFVPNKTRHNRQGGNDGST